VITAGGIIGRVLDIRAEEGIAYVELAEGVIVRAITASLLQAYDPQELAANARKGLPTSSDPLTEQPAPE
jgi:preprotein translocase subunit YajC